MRHLDDRYTDDLKHEILRFHILCQEIRFKLVEKAQELRSSHHDPQALAQAVMDDPTIKDLRERLEELHTKIQREFCLEVSAAETAPRPFAPTRLSQAYYKQDIAADYAGCRMLLSDSTKIQELMSQEDRSYEEKQLINCRELYCLYEQLHLIEGDVAQRKKFNDDKEVAEDFYRYVTKFIDYQGSQDKVSVEEKKK